MPRKILDDMNRSEIEENGKMDYRPPDEKLVDSEMVNWLIEHYIDGRDDKRLNLMRESGFESEVTNLESVIKDAGDILRTQAFIDTLTFMLRDESDYEKYSRTHFLTAIIQALYNLDYSSEFVLDIRKWPGSGDDVGSHLKCTPDKPLTLDFYGNSYWCGDFAEHCNFIIHDRVYKCGYYWPKHCSFTIHGRVELCGWDARHCRFDLMPDAKIKWYSALESLGNKLRKMNEKGEWEIISHNSTR